MTISPTQSRFLLAGGTILAAAAGAVVAFGVIPGVRVAESPQISPQQAIPAFWISVGLQVAAALVLALTAALSRERSKLSTSVLVVTGAVMLLLGFVLGDAAVAFREAGSATSALAALVTLCVAADVLAGASALGVAFLRPASSRYPRLGAARNSGDGQPR